MIRKKIIKNGSRSKIPLTVVFILSAVIVAAAFNIKTEPDRLFGKFLYICSVFSMPDSVPSVVSDMKNSAVTAVKVYLGESNTEFAGFFQKTGDVTGENSDNESFDISDLTVTPPDILKTMSSFDSGLYEEDGSVKEKTFTDDQATDSYGNVHIRNVTETKDADVEKILSDGCKLPVDDYGLPTVLIYHTHSTETYLMNDNGKFSSSYPSRNEDVSVNMVRVGDEITKVLSSNGIGVIHDSEIHDSTYTGAYNNSRATEMKYLEKNPSIQITLDIHRDAVYYDNLTRIKPYAEIENKKAAQMMIIAGTEDGNVTDFPNWETNLAFAVTLQKTANDKYKNLMKPIYFCCRKYNMDMTPYSLLIEIGTDVNTLEEAAYSGRLLGDVLSEYIKEN